MPLEFHPICELLPMMTEDEFSALRDDISRNGLLEPIWIYQGQILDGRNRYRACVDLGIEPATREYTGDTPATFVLSMHTRRDLTQSQKAAVAVSFLPHLEEEASRRRLATQNNNAAKADPSPVTEQTKGESREHAAKVVGCGATFVTYAKRVHDESPEMFDRVKRGELSVKKAYAALPKPKAFEANGDVVVTKPRKLEKSERAKQIEGLVASGHRAEQVADKLGLDLRYVRQIANEHGIAFHGAKTARIKTDRVIQETVNSLIGLSGGLAVVKDSLDDLDPKQAGEWAEAISEPLKSLNWMSRKLREVADGN